MKTKHLVLTLILLTFSGLAAAAETCGEMRKINGVLTSVDVPCKTLETPKPCVRQRQDSNGSIRFEEVACAPGQAKTVEQAHRDNESAQKKKCGKDFQAMRVGMSLNRYQECNEALDYVTDTVSQAGVVKTYQGTFWYIHAKDGMIVSYTRRTN